MLAYAVAPTLTTTDAYTAAQEKCEHLMAQLRSADTRLIQDYLGHRNIQHTVMYTATNPARFERLWR